jgi:diaminopimelate epimerase
MLIPFIKMNAQGNDFVILDLFAHELPELDHAKLSEQICDRHFGVGADGLVILKPCKDAEAQMIIFNNDGSRAEMCGSALRCVAWLMMTKLERTELEIRTDSGIKHAIREVDFIRVNLGKPRMLQSNMPVKGFLGDLVDIGNPHYIVFREDVSDDPHLMYGAMLEHHPAFTKPVNAHFVQVVDSDLIKLKIWEHACGATLACGTGAASAVFAGITRGILEHQVAVEVPGGSIFITAQTDGSMLLSGEVAENFRGTYLWKT